MAISSTADIPVMQHIKVGIKVREVPVLCILPLTTHLKQSEG